MTTMVAPAALATGATAVAGWTALEGSPSEDATVVAEPWGPDSVYTRVAVTFVVALVGVRAV
jgi:hypothetical protein